jgi:hypothetical protein
MEPITFADPHLSVEARGAIIFLLATGRTTFTLDDLRAANMGRDAAYKVRGELQARNLARKSSGSTWELINFYGFTYFRISGNPEIELLRSSTVLESDSGESVEAAKTSGNPEIRKDVPEPAQQQPLEGLSEPPSPVPPPPSRPARAPRPAAERKPPTPPEVQALYSGLFELTKSPRKGRRAMGVFTIARNLWGEFQATPAQVGAFWSWFKLFSEPARHAARERRDINPPMPRQVYEFWPQFLVWWRAKQDADARETARREQEAIRPVEASERPASGRAAMERYHPFRRTAEADAALPAGRVA